MAKKETKTAEQKAQELAAQIKQEVEEAAGAGMNAARLFLVARVKEAISVPAPRKKVVSNAGEIYYRATTPAIPGAPIRKLSGQARMKLTSRMVSKTEFEIGDNAKSKTGVNYPRVHEVKNPGNIHSGQHPFVWPTVEKYHAELRKIIGEAFLKISAE